ncbi:hypothetical protein DVG40_22575 [Salmonella enterica subsp. enterica serovar Inganda]|nr:hypothetical protein [Salmonella enterica subsp. enterica serovar Inganda]
MIYVFPAQAEDTAITGKEELMIIEMKIGQRSYDIALDDNPTAQELIQQFPLTLTMQDLNGNEKFADLSDYLIVNHVSPGTLHKGDLMLYGSKTLVLFYKTFQSSYRYTPIGKVVAPDTLQDAVGHSSVKVSFTMKKPKEILSSARH